MKFFIVVGLIIFSSSILAGRGQLDPHGLANVDYRKLKISKSGTCQVCHFEKNGKVKTYKNSQVRCTGCHGKMPHSGLAEHKFDCLTCHRPHRFTAVKKQRAADAASIKSSFIYSKRTTHKVKGTVERRSRMPMLSMGCIGCHSSVD